VSFQEGDAENLPFPDASFDAVLWCLGVMFTALDEPGQRSLHDELVALAQEFDRATGPSVAMPAEYLETIAIRR
jgi:hypothetical protein